MVNKLKVSDEDFLTCSTLSSTISITNFSITLHVTTSFPCCLLIIFSLLYFFVAALSFCCQFFFCFFAPLHFFLGALFCCHHFSCFLLPLYFIIAALFFCLLKKRSGEEEKRRGMEKPATKKYGAATYVSRSYVLPYISWGSAQLQKGIQPINLNYAFFF